MQCPYCNSTIIEPLYKYLDPANAFGLFFIVFLNCDVCFRKHKIYERENILFDAYNLMEIHYTETNKRGIGKTYSRTLRLQIMV